VNNLRQLQLNDLQLSTCTRWVNPAGVTVLPIPHVIPFYYQIAASSVADGVEIATHAEFPFLLKVLSFTGTTPGTLVRLQWPDGRYLSNPGLDFFSFIRTGRLGRLIDPHKRLLPAQKIRLDIDNSAVGSAAVLELYLEGVLEVPLIQQSGGAS
jgi:hypothetical protein